VALLAESDEIFFGIIPQVASPLDVMDLQGVHSSALLATPTISLKDLLTEPLVFVRLKL
jgi:hypothetical protein